MSSIVTIVQARTGSSRLPGKVLMPLGCGTVLDVMLDRVKAALLAGTIVVATTTDPSDDPIVAIAERHGMRCYRGHATDLLDRHYHAAREHNAQHVVKIPSDCPLIDPDIIDNVLAAYLANDRADFVSNLHPPTHPDGNDVEVMSFNALEATWREASREFEREHTTPFIWNQPERFHTANAVWSGGRDCAQSHRVVLDYAEDYALIRQVHEALGSDGARYTVDDIVRYLDENPAVYALNAAHRGVSWYRHHLDELPALNARGAHALQNA